MQKGDDINTATTTPCRSYSSLTFDGCPACVDAALDAIGQAGAYLVAQSASGMVWPAESPLQIAHLLKLRFTDDRGNEIGSDELLTEQTISVVGDELSIEVADDADAPDSLDDPSAMRLEDFQTVIDKLALAPSGSSGLRGKIDGRLYGFDRAIGTFEIEVQPAG